VQHPVDPLEDPGHGPPGEQRLRRGATAELIE
jgi:hypothetical protein